MDPRGKECLHADCFCFSVSQHNKKNQACWSDTKQISLSCYQTRTYCLTESGDFVRYIMVIYSGQIAHGYCPLLRK